METAVIETPIHQPLNSNNQHPTLEEVQNNGIIHTYMYITFTIPTKTYEIWMIKSKESESVIGGWQLLEGVESRSSPGL